MNEKMMLVPLILSLLLLGACNAESQIVNQEQTEPGENINSNDVEKTNKATVDEELKREFEKEHGVSDMSLVITEDYGVLILLDFEVEEDMKEDEATLIVKRYYERLEKEYPEHSIDIQARKSGETFVQETKEVK